MTRDFRCLTPDTFLLEAFAAMLGSHVHHLPVVGPDERCLLVLELTAVVRRLPEDLVAQGNAPLVSPGAIGPLSIRDDELLTRAAAAMTDAGTDACCPVDPLGRMVGLLTVCDVVAAVARRSGSPSS
jgi:CBS domain-containing protein